MILSEDDHALILREINRRIPDGNAFTKIVNVRDCWFFRWYHSDRHGFFVDSSNGGEWYTFLCVDGTHYNATNWHVERVSLL